MELSGIETWYERVLCEAVNWYIVDSVRVASYSHTHTKYVIMSPFICPSSSGPASPSSPPPQVT